MVEDKFKEAQGGILFIDEAYALVDSSNTYGAEAINTVVQMMENYRDSVIVIFAGYSEKMQTFLEQNEGLKSRIAFSFVISGLFTGGIDGYFNVDVPKTGLSDRRRSKRILQRTFLQCRKRRQLRKWQICKKYSGPGDHKTVCAYSENGDQRRHFQRRDLPVETGGFPDSRNCKKE